MGIEREEGKAGKHLLKQARKISDEAVAHFLDDVSLSNLFFDNRYGILTLVSWDPTGGEREWTIEDAVFGLAVMLYLERQGVPVIANQQELEDLARRNGWINFPYRSDQ